MGYLKIFDYLMFIKFLNSISSMSLVNSELNWNCILVMV